MYLHTMERDVVFQENRNIEVHTFKKKKKKSNTMSILQTTLL